MLCWKLIHSSMSCESISTILFITVCLTSKKTSLFRFKLYRMFAIIFEEIVSTPHSAYAESVLLWFSFCFTLFHLCIKNMIFQLALSRPKLSCFFHGVLSDFRLNVFFVLPSTHHIVYHLTWDNMKTYEPTFLLPLYSRHENV